MPKRSVSRRATRGLVTASLLGVGAPEALVIGVVALLVFGPKGLAEVARNVGKTLKTFQPTIKELQVRASAFISSLFARCKIVWFCSLWPPVVLGRGNLRKL
jgi:TatA/E family protein of Tat protein translocase